MTDDTIGIRAATASDAPAITALLTELGYPVERAAVPGRLSAIVKEGGMVVVAIDAGGAVLGLMSMARHSVLHAGGPVAYITALVTASAARRRGVGQRLVAAAKEWAEEHGCVRLTVTSAERRADAHAFYPACGMPYTGRRFATTIGSRPRGES